MFDFEQWKTMTEQIPQEHYGAALRAVLDRKKAIEDEPRRVAQEIATARQIHEAMAGTVEHVDGVPVWSAPAAPALGHPPGWQVHHAGEVWVQTSDRVTVGEPGVSSDWMPTNRPEPEPELAQEEVMGDE